MRELISSIRRKNLNITYFNGTGGGGQHRNKHANCVRMHHSPSGSRSVCQDFREKRRNEVGALNRLAKSREFINWTKIQAGFSLRIEDEVDKMMRPENLLVETYEPN